MVLISRLNLDNREQLGLGNLMSATVVFISYGHSAGSNTNNLVTNRYQDFEGISYYSIPHFRKI